MYLNGNCHVFIHRQQTKSSMSTGEQQESSLPQDGQFGWSNFVTLQSLEGIVANVFADVSSHECERQHGGQRGIMQCSPNLEQIFKENTVNRLQTRHNMAQQCVWPPHVFATNCWMISWGWGALSCDELHSNHNSNQSNSPLMCPNYALIF